MCIFQCYSSTHKWQEQLFPHGKQWPYISIPWMLMTWLFANFSMSFLHTERVAITFSGMTMTSYINTMLMTWLLVSPGPQQSISWPSLCMQSLNTLRPRQNGCHSADDSFKCIFLNENVWILIKVSQKFVPKGPINNILALVQIMAWHRPGDKPLSELMMFSLLTHIGVTWLQWVNF